MLSALKDQGHSLAIYGSKSWLEYPKLKENYKGFVKTEEFDDRLAEGKVVLAMLEDHLTGSCI